MKIGNKVKTILGTGTIIKQEGDEGILAHRFLVKLDFCPKHLKYLHNRYDGLFILEKEMEVIT